MPNRYREENSAYLSGGGSVCALHILYFDIYFDGGGVGTARFGVGDVEMGRR